MATSSPRAVLPPRTIEMPTSPRQHYVSAASPEATSPSRVPRISLNPRPVLKDVKNILPSTSQVPSLSRRQPTRWVSKQPETQLRPSSMLRHSSSPTSTSLFSQPLITRRAPPTSPLAIPKREDASKPSTATIYGHVRSRHKMVPMVSPHARIVSETPPFISSPVKNPQPLTARSLPASSSLVDSMSFDLLKDPIFDGYYGPSASLDSLATVRCLSDDRRQVYEKSCPTRYRSVHPSRTSSRHDGISKSTPQANYIRSPICPIRAGPLLPPAPERPSKQSRHCPALTFPEAWRLPTESPPLSAGTIQVKLPSTNMLMKDDAVGFPVDMLDMLNTLETLATKVKTLEMPERVPKAKGNGCVRENDTRKINIEHRDMPTDNGLPVDKVPLMFNRLEKGKWRCIKPDLQGCTDKAFSISASGSNRPHLKLPNSQGWNMHGYIYNPYNAPEFLAGCSTSPVLYRAYGCHSRITQRTPHRKLSLPSRLALPKLQGFAASPTHFCQSEQRTVSPSTLSPSVSPSNSPQSPPRKPTTLKSLLHRSRPRSRSDVIPKLRASAMPISHHPAENIPVRGLLKPRFHWLKF